MRMRVALSVLTSVVAGAASSAGTAAAQSLNGYTIVLGVTADSTRPPLTLTVKAAGAKIRVEADGLPMMGMGGGGGGGGMAAGAYLLPLDSGKVAAIVPAFNMGIVLDLASLGGGGRGGGRGGRGRARGGAGGGGGGGGTGEPMPAVPEVTDVTTNVEDLGAGGSILGHPTRKYRIRTTYTVNGNKQDDVSETWFATDLSGSDEGFAKFYTTFGAAFGGRNSSKTVADAVRAKMPKGFPVKVVTTSNTANGPAVTTIEATEITKTSFDPAEFELPAGIQLMDPAGMFGGRRGGK